MTAGWQEGVGFNELEERLRTMLPNVYEGCYNDLQSVSMGSAGLRYGSDGKVEWDKIWGSFCDLAMAGGPPHRGTLLVPASQEEIEADAEGYREVVHEICRGIASVTGLFAEPSPVVGWIQMHCTSAGMAGWLARALTTENISSGFRGLVLYLPAGPRFRLEKEIKNVITSVAKTCHYWLEHTAPERHWEISRLLATMEAESPLLQPPLFERNLQIERQKTLEDDIAKSMLHATGLRCTGRDHVGWMGLDCGDVRAAVWMMRMLVVSNVLSRREGTRVFVPVNSVSDSNGDRIESVFVRVHGFAVAQGVFRERKLASFERSHHQFGHPGNNA